jgi:glycosyltransferase involved in cell wall biosynthesis
LIIPVLERLSKKYSIQLKIIGAKIPIVENLEMLLSIGICKLKLMNSSSDIGIMPLKYTMFENGKCGFKLIQYMASGLPVVASALPANKEIVQDGSNGYIVTNDGMVH